MANVYSAEGQTSTRSDEAPKERYWPPILPMVTLTEGNWELVAKHTQHLATICDEISVSIDPQSLLFLAKYFGAMERWRKPLRITPAVKSSRILGGLSREWLEIDAQHPWETYTETMKDALAMIDNKQTGIIHLEDVARCLDEPWASHIDYEAITQHARQFRGTVNQVLLYPFVMQGDRDDAYKYFYIQQAILSALPTGTSFVGSPRIMWTNSLANRGLDYACYLCDCLRMQTQNPMTYIVCLGNVFADKGWPPEELPKTLSHVHEPDRVLLWIPEELLESLGAMVKTLVDAGYPVLEP
jgi:hypothetical protein